MRESLILLQVLLWLPSYHFRGCWTGGATLVVREMPDKA